MTTPAARIGMTEQELRDHVARLTTALEAERQWRLNAPSALLAAETRAHRAESEVARLQGEVIRLQGFLLGPMPEPLAPTDHGTVEACVECGSALDGDVQRGGSVGPNPGDTYTWAVHDRCYDTFITQELAGTDVTT